MMKHAQFNVVSVKLEEVCYKNFDDGLQSDTKCVYSATCVSHESYLTSMIIPSMPNNAEHVLLMHSTHLYPQVYN